VLWLVSFTDLMSLMLAFFVLMFSMTEPQAERWKAMSQSLSLSARSTARTASDAPHVPRAVFNAATVETRGAANLDYLGALLRSQFAQAEEMSGVSVRREDDRVVIDLPGDLLFEPGRLAFSPGGRRMLFDLGAVVGRIGNRVEVVGHAEGEDVPAGLVWERALARAVTVAAMLRGSGTRRDLVVRALMIPEGTPGAADSPRVGVVIREQEG
jgi:chemotaxis protein MotB